MAQKGRNGKDKKDGYIRPSSRIKSASPEKTKIKKRKASREDFYVVGIAASAGGPEVLEDSRQKSRNYCIELYTMINGLMKSIK